MLSVSGEGQTVYAAVVRICGHVKRPCDDLGYDTALYKLSEMDR